MSSLPCKGVTKNGNHCPVLISLKKIEEQTKLSQQCFPKAGFIDFQYCKKTRRSSSSDFSVWVYSLIQITCNLVYKFTQTLNVEEVNQPV